MYGLRLLLYNNNIISYEEKGLYELYIFSDNIQQAEHDAFVKGHPQGGLLQSSSWAKVKDNWGHAIVGVTKDGELAASALVLIKKLPLGLCVMYTPRGPVMDYSDAELVFFFFSEMKKWARGKGCAFIKFDPAVTYREYFLKDKDTAPVFPEAETAAANIMKTGARFNGLTKNIIDSTQPRYQMGIYACDDFESRISKDARKSKNAAVKKHVEVARYGEDMLPEFASIMQLTEERKNINLRDIDYFRRLMDTYGDEAYLFLSSVDPHIRAGEVRARLAELDAALADPGVPNGTATQLRLERQNLEGELDAMAEVLEKYPGKTYIAGALMLGFGDNVEMLYAGMNSDFRVFKPQYLSHFVRFQYLFDKGYKYVSMGGVEGTLDDGLTGYKSKYNAMIREYIGEYDLPVMKLLFAGYLFLKKIRK